jgi:hypothetical protein
MSRYRVVQWATGGMGRNVLRAIIDHPALELVGVYVYGGDKAGRDAGELARRPTTGVQATNDRARILALDADVVVHAGRIVPPYGSHDVDLIELLESGKNVISINGYSHPRHWVGPRLEALEAACRRGGTTLLGAGLNPGFAAEQLAAVATGVCTSIDHVEVIESVSCAPVRNPTYVFDALGFGADPQAIDPNRPDYGPAASLNGMYEEVLAALAHRLSLPLERVETAHRAHPATEDLHVAAGTIRRGTVSHFNWRWHGIVAGRACLTMSIHWYMETAHLDEPAPPLWRIHVRGQPGVRMSVDFEKREGDTSPTSPEQIAVAGSVVNAIPVVCAAPPGVMTRPIATPYDDRLAKGMGASLPEG